MLQKNLVLTGLSGAGKSHVAALLARRLGCPVLDLDEAIVRRAGMPVDRIFEKLGESYFRKLEAELLIEALGAPPHVIATGGGALVNPDSRARALASGVVVWLRVSPEVAASRCARSERRPLLEGDAVGRLEALLEARQEAYGQAHLSVDTDSASAESVTEQVLMALEAA